MFMKLIVLLLFAVINLLAASQSSLAAVQECIEANNAAVRLLSAGQIEESLVHFERALKLDPTYKLARDNYAIALNNLGLKLTASNKSAALKYFRQAYYVDSSNNTTLQNIESCIRLLSKDPASWSDRVALADAAFAGADYIGAIVELKAAIQLHPQDAELYVKLGQMYQAVHDFGNATASIYKGVQMKPEDQAFRQALKAAWEDGLKANPLEPTNHIGLGQALELCGEPKQAEEEYRLAIRFSRGSNAVAEDLLAKLLAKQGK